MLYSSNYFSEGLQNVHKLYTVLSAGGRIRAPKDIYILIPRICDYVCYMAKEFLQKWLRTLKWGSHSGLFGCTLYNHKGPSKGKRKAGVSVLERYDVRKSWLCSAGFENGDKECERQGDEFSLRASRRNTVRLTSWF